MSQRLDLVMRRRVGSRGGWQPILQRLAFGLYATDQHDWKLSHSQLSEAVTDQSSAWHGTAIRLRAGVAKIA